MSHGDYYHSREVWSRTEPNFLGRRTMLRQLQLELITRTNEAEICGNGIYTRWRWPVLTAAHTPLFWRYDLDPVTNPYMMERMGINAVFNAGAIYLDGKFLLMARVEGADRKSFFAIAESETGVDNFRFRDHPVILPQTDRPDINVYDMRLTQHEDGWIYGLFCTERKDETKPEDSSAAVAACGIARSRDMEHWERLPDLISHSGQQRNVVLHPEFVNGQYALYTRPQDGFISVGAGGGIGWALTEDITHAEVRDEDIIDAKAYHTIKEVKNGLGPVPLKTDQGWLHLAHGVRNTASGLRYVLYMFMTDLKEPWRVTNAPGGYFLAPKAGERVGDVSNIAFSNGWIRTADDRVYIYYASSDTRVHVATSSVAQLTDYVLHTPEDPLSSAACVKQRIALINKNLEALRNPKEGPEAPPVYQPLR